MSNRLDPRFAPNPSNSSNAYSNSYSLGQPSRSGGHAGPPMQYNQQQQAK